MISRRIFVLLALAPVFVCAQTVKLDALDKLAEKASEVVTVTLPANLLKLASRVLSNGEPDEAAVKKIVANLRGVYVRHFEFDRAGEYQPADLDPIHAQLRDPKWKKIVDVRSRTENADVMLRQEDEDNISGLVVILTEPTELTVVYIDGPIDLDGLTKLAASDHFGIPEDLPARIQKEKGKEKEKEKKAK